MNDAINLALDQNLISLQMLEECDNVLMVSIPRLAILIGVKENIDTNGPIDLLNLFEDASIEEIRVLLQNFSRHRYQILCRMIVDSNTEEMTDDLSIVEAFRFICGLADKLHSGKHAHFLADTLSRIFTQFQT